MDKHNKAVIVGGVRSPFLKAFGDFTRMDTITLGRSVVSALLERYALDKNEVDSICWGGVILPSQTVNVGREIVLDLGMPAAESSTVTRACTSGLRAIVDAVCQVERGEAEVVIAGGSDSTSNAEVTLPPTFVHKAAPVVLSGRSGPLDYLELLKRLDGRDLMPRRPAIKERTTGELMGESAEKMGVRNAISRQAMDRFAVQSHQRAAAAWESGRFDDEVVPITTVDGRVVRRDNIVRGETSLDKMAKLKPAFKRDGGGVTAACLVMNAEKAKALGYKPLAAFRGWSFDAVDPSEQMLMGPAISMPKALMRAGMTYKDIDVVDIHEAFAAQVLSVLRMLGSEDFVRHNLGRWGIEKAVAAIDPQTINLHGGSIAIGHPFGATGARMVITMANELANNGKATAWLGICGAGGVSAGAVMEAV